MRHRLPPLETLRYLEACGRHNSFTKAAHELSVTHGAVSQRIKTLEESIGVKLFERHGNAMLLTHRGRLLYLDVARMLEDLRKSVAAVHALEDQLTLKISFPPALAARWLYPRLFQFTRDHPEIEIVVGTGPALSNFQDDGVELAVRFGGGTWPGLEAFKLLDEEFFPVCSPGFFEEYRPTEPADLLHIPMLKDSFIPWDIWFRPLGLPSAQEVRGTSFSDANLLLRAAVDGQGVALGRQTLVADDLEAGRLIRLFSQGARGTLAYYVVHPRGAQSVPKIRQFTDWLRAQAGELTS